LSNVRKITQTGRLLTVKEFQQLHEGRFTGGKALNQKQEIRNPKSETRNKLETRKSQKLKTNSGFR